CVTGVQTCALPISPLPLWLLVLGACITVPCMLLGLVLGGWTKSSLNETARWVDGHQRLQERLSTALEVANGPSTGSWSELVLRDAADHARGLDPRRLVPFSLPRLTRWALVVLALTVGLGFVPEYRSKALLAKQSDRQNI